MRNHPHMRKVNDWQLVVLSSFTMLALLHVINKINIDLISDHSIIFGDIAVGTIALLLTRKYCNTQFFYLRLPANLNRFLLASLFVFALYYLNGGTQNFHIGSASKIFWGTLSVLAIGFGEELFGRLFIAGILQKYGLLYSAFYSSLCFALMHLSNFGNGQSFGGTSIQVINAFGWGFLAFAIVKYTDSIIPVILFHALLDSPMFLTAHTHHHASGGSVILGILFTVLTSTLCVVAGIWMLSKTPDWLLKEESEFRLGKHLEPLLVKLGLIEKDEFDDIN
ncbi:MAG: CPBP family intramembrane metalloprotease [Actinobacteria bacterium]|nr:CPBP family intramembrane metalloprotease [Actinomycetota bacterium]